MAASACIAGRGSGARESRPRTAAPPVATTTHHSVRPAGAFSTSIAQCAAAKAASAAKAVSRRASESRATAAAERAVPVPAGVAPARPAGAPAAAGPG